MSNVLFLVHRIPYPPNKGDKIRSYYLLRHLSQHHDVYLGTFIDDPRDAEHLEKLRSYCVEVFARSIGGWRSKVSAIKSLLSRDSLSVGYYASAEMSNWVLNTIQNANIDVVIAFSSTMARFVPDSADHDFRCVADFVDLDSDKWQQFSKESSWPKSLMYTYEAGALSRWEEEIADRVDAVTFVSSEEKRLMQQRSPATVDKIGVVRNGVDHDFFDPAKDFESPYGGDRPIIVFTGAMDYLANEDGVCWFAKTVWSDLRQIIPALEFWIVGSNPTRQVLELNEIEGITVTGFVDDVRPYLKYADIAIAPLALARGVQNKVLEALAMNLPVVATPQALQGLEGKMPATISSETDGRGFTSAICHFLENTETGDHGRQYVLDYYDWGKNLEDLDKTLRELGISVASSSLQEAKSTQG